MTDNTTPSVNPANTTTLEGAIDLKITKTLQSLANMLPAKVISYNRNTNIATVQPLITSLDTNNNQTARPQVQVPVFQSGAGGFVISFPINTGDLGWIKSNDRDISLYLQSKQLSPPNTYRLHDYGDSMFIPDCLLNGVTIANAGNLVIQSYDGTTCISLGSGQISIKAPTSITLDSPLINITGSIQAGTNPSYGATAAFNGTVTTTGDVVASGTHLHTHTHGGVQTGSGNTAVPN